MSVPQIKSMPVYTKKLNKITYHLATFSEPLTKQATSNLPRHIIEEPAEELLPKEETKTETQDTSHRDKFANVHHYMSKLQNSGGQDYRKPQSTSQAPRLQN